MLFKLLIILITLSPLMGQSMFNRWIGSDPFSGSSKSTAMGNSHILNSIGSANTRFNPANLINENSIFTFDIQLEQTSIFERWSMPIRDSFDDVLANADYVANEFSQFGIRGGLSSSINIFQLGQIGIGFHSAPLTNFKYHYTEEVRGTNQIEDGEYASKDPIVGYHNLKTSGAMQISSLGTGFGINLIKQLKIKFGLSINQIHRSTITDNVTIDSLYLEDLTNLSTVTNVTQRSKTDETNFITLSAMLQLTPKITLASSWESSAKLKSKNSSAIINNENGLFQYWNNQDYAINGHNYLKPEILSFGSSFFSNNHSKTLISFEFNRIFYDNHYYLNDFNIIKFGFEHITQFGTPIRAGLTYKTPSMNAMEPISILTFGSGKKINNLILDITGTYCLQSFKHPDLFPVEGDVRLDYDLIRDSQFHLSLSLSYQL
tara:strand:+ start:4873 stop:6171 length:1299 start_codon:yes stop_codon:yes gene_type:complete